MKFLAVAALAGAAAAGWSGHGNVTYTTEVVTAYTTYCPEATTLTFSSKTYTITKPTTLTITDCPCTVSKPVMTSTVTACTTCGHANSTATYVAPTGGYTTPAGGVTTSAGATPSHTAPVTAGAGKVGLSLAAIVAAVAAL
jgi:hypothetical protein